jgi:hypothetical protein
MLQHWSCTKQVKKSVHGIMLIYSKTGNPNPVFKESSPTSKGFNMLLFIKIGGKKVKNQGSLTEREGSVQLTSKF